MTPEQRARQQIDSLLQQCGWIIQNRSETNLAAGPGVAIREALLKTGGADYLLFAGGKAIATVEVKPERYTLIGVEGVKLEWRRAVCGDRGRSEALTFLRPIKS
jgi:type I restriction enzyme, R subunit